MRSELEYFRRFVRWKHLITLLAIAVFITAILSVNIGFTQIPLVNVMRILAKNTPVIGQLVSFSDISSSEETILMQIRLPRILTGILVGAALAASGVVFQATFRNPLADPYVLGVSAGAAVGGATALVAGLNRGLLGSNAISVMAFIGAVSTSFVVYDLARVGGRTPIITLLLSGIAVSIFLSAIVTIMIVLSNPYLGELQALIFWLLGSLAYSFWREVWAAAPFILAGLVVLNLFARQLNIMLLGEEDAEHLGLETEKLKRVTLIFASLTTSAAVAISGIIGFVGLMIPHITRILVGPDHRILLPSAIMVGAIYLVFFDAVARVVYRPAEFPVGVITALAGGPFFLYLLKKKRGEYAL